MLLAPGTNSMSSSLLWLAPSVRWLAASAPSLSTDQLLVVDDQHLGGHDVLIKHQLAIPTAQVERRDVGMPAVIVSCMAVASTLPPLVTGIGLRAAGQRRGRRRRIDGAVYQWGSTLSR